MANICEKDKSILTGNLNSGLSYLITTVCTKKVKQGSVFSNKWKKLPIGKLRISWSLIPNSTIITSKLFY